MEEYYSQISCSRFRAFNHSVISLGFGHLTFNRNYYLRATKDQGTSSWLVSRCHQKQTKYQTSKCSRQHKFTSCALISKCLKQALQSWMLHQWIQHVFSNKFRICLLVGIHSAVFGRQQPNYAHKAEQSCYGSTTFDWSNWWFRNELKVEGIRSLVWAGASLIMVSAGRRMTVIHHLF